MSQAPPSVTLPPLTPRAPSAPRAAGPPRVRKRRHELERNGADSGGSIRFSGAPTCHWGCPMSRFENILPELNRNNKKRPPRKESNDSLKEEVVHYSDPVAPKEIAKEREIIVHYSDRIDQLGDELKKFGEQAKNVEDIVLADSYANSISEKLLEIVEKITGQTATIMPQPPPEVKPSSADSPSSVPEPLLQTLREENSRLRRELADARAEVSSLSATVGYYITKERDKAAIYCKWLQQYALGGRIFLYDTVGIHTVFQSWSRYTAIVRHHRKEAEGRIALATRCVHKTERQQNFTTLAMCFTHWSAKGNLRNLEARLARMREARLKAAVLGFVGADQALLKQCVDAWHLDAFTSARSRFRKEQAMAQMMRKMEKETNEALRQVLLTWQKESRKEALRRKNLEQVAKLLLGEEAHLKSQCVTGWYTVTTQEKQERLFEEQRRKAAEALERARQQKLAAIGKSLGLAAQFLLEVSWKGWLEVLQRIRDAKKKQQDGMSRAMRMIFGQQQALLLEIFAIWMEEVRNGRMLRMKESKERMAAARKRALAMFERTLKESLEALIFMSMQEWRNVAADITRRRFRKEQVLAQALRRIELQDKEFLKQLVGAWVEVKKKSHLRKKRMEQVARNLLSSEATIQLQFLMAWSIAAKESKQEEQRRKAAEALERARQQKLAAISKSLGLAAQCLLEVVWKGWLDVVQRIKDAKKKQQDGMSRAMRMIFGQQQALLLEIFAIWMEEVREGRMLRMKESKERMAAARKRALAMFERTLKESLEALLLMSMQEWRNVAAEVTRRRFRKEQVLAQAMRRLELQDKEFLKLLVDAWVEVKKKSQLRKKRMEQVAQSLLSSEATIKLHCLMAWAAATKELKQERLLEEQRRKAAEQLERARQQKMAAIGRSLGIAAEQLLESSWKAWLDLFNRIREAKRKQADGMSRAMRMIFGQQQALLAEVYTFWLDELRKGRLARMKESKERIVEARRRALRMLERSLNGGLETLMIVTTQAWADEAKAAKKFRKEKEDVMERVLRNISRTEKMWIPVFFGYWEKIARLRVGRLRKAQELIGHLSDLLVLKYLWTLWSVRTQILKTF